MYYQGHYDRLFSPEIYHVHQTNSNHCSLTVVIHLCQRPTGHTERKTLLPVTFPIPLALGVRHDKLPGQRVVDGARTRMKQYGSVSVQVSIDVCKAKYGDYLPSFCCPRWQRRPCSIENERASLEW